MTATPMALGPYQFESLKFGFNGIGRDLNTSWASISTVGGLNRLQWTGGDDDTVMIEGVLFPEEFGGLDTLEGVRTAAQSGLVLPLVTLAGNVYGMYVVESVSEDQSYHDRYGMPRMDVFRLGLKRFVGTGFAPVSIVETLFG